MYETMVFKISAKESRLPCASSLWCYCSTFSGYEGIISVPEVSVLGFLDGRYIQGSGITNSDLYKGVVKCFIVLAFSLMAIPFLVNEMSESSVYLHDPCPVKNSFVYKDMCK